MAADPIASSSGSRHGIRPGVARPFERMYTWPKKADEYFQRVDHAILDTI
jgi:hypothetical protein